MDNFVFTVVFSSIKNRRSSYSSAHDALVGNVTTNNNDGNLSYRGTYFTSLFCIKKVSDVCAQSELV